MNIKFGIVTCSSTRSIEEDTAGARLEGLIAEQGWTTLSRVVVKDDVDMIADAIVCCCDAAQLPRSAGVCSSLTCLAPRRPPRRTGKGFSTSSITQSR